MTHPAPEVPARVAEPGEVPAGARRMAATAGAAGWRVVCTYARGTRPGRTPKVVDSIAVRLLRGQRRAAAVWLDNKFTDAFTWGAAEQFRTHTATSLTAALKEAFDERPSNWTVGQADGQEPPVSEHDHFGQWLLELEWEHGR